MMRIIFLLLCFFYATCGFSMMAPNDPDLLERAHVAAKGPEASSTVALMFGFMEADGVTLRQRLDASGVVLQGGRHILTCLHGAAQCLAERHKFLRVSSAPIFEVSTKNVLKDVVEEFRLFPYPGRVTEDIQHMGTLGDLVQECNEQFHELLGSPAVSDDSLLGGRAPMYPGSKVKIRSGDLMIIQLKNPIRVGKEGICKIAEALPAAGVPFMATSYGYASSETPLKNGALFRRLAIQGPVSLNVRHQCFYKTILSPEGTEERGFKSSVEHPLVRPFLRGESGGILVKDSEILGIVSAVTEHPLQHLRNRFDQLRKELEKEDEPGAVAAAVGMRQTVHGAIDGKLLPICNMWTPIDAKARAWINSFLKM